MEEVKKQIQFSVNYGDNATIWHEFKTDELVKLLSNIVRLERENVVNEFLHKGYLDSKTPLITEKIFSNG